MSTRLSTLSPSPTLLTSSMIPHPHGVSGFQLSKVRCRVHPSVILTMLDAHGRLRESNEFAIGTLLGTIASEGGTKGSGMVVVEIVDCFANPYHWDRTTTALTIQKEQHEWMLKLREKINPKLSVVGWCCTTNTVLYTTALSDWAKSEHKVSRFIPSKALPEPIHILLDPTFSNQLSILNETKAYIRGPLRQLFHEVPLEMTINPSDALGIASIIKTSTVQQVEKVSTASLQDSTETLATALKNLQSLVIPCLEYIQQVLHGEKKGDPEIGRALMRTICLETLLPQEEVEAMCESSMQDSLMIAYLTNLARLQFTVAEKLNTSFN